MPIIKGGITFGKDMSDKDLDKFCKASGRVLLKKKGVAVKQKPKKQIKKKGKITTLIPKGKK